MIGAGNWTDRKRGQYGGNGMASWTDRRTDADQHQAPGGLKIIIIIGGLSANRSLAWRRLADGPCTASADAVSARRIRFARRLAAKTLPAALRALLYRRVAWRQAGRCAATKRHKTSWHAALRRQFGRRAATQRLAKRAFWWAKLRWR
jgi:hypothetical protein